MSVLFKNLCFNYGGEGLFSSFNLSLDGRPTAILGPSGCGKTSLLRLAAGLLKPLNGKVELLDGGVSFVFQEPRLLPWRTVWENVALPLYPSFGREGAGQRASHYLNLVALDDRQAAYPDELSGGQKQRVSIARAFAFPAALVLMDEAFQSLDLPLRIQLMDLTQSLLAEEPRALLAVTHDPREAIYLAQRIIVLSSPPVRIILDEEVTLSREERAYASQSPAELEARLFAALQGLSS